LSIEGSSQDLPALDFRVVRTFNLESSTPFQLDLISTRVSAIRRTTSKSTTKELIYVHTAAVESETIMLNKIFALLFLVASASAFAPAPFGARVSTRIGMGDKVYGKYDDKLWDNEAKKEIYNAWDPNQPRSPMNFNPFETWEGNSPDASGFYPGENRYKDPARGDINFAAMMVEREEAEQRAANPKPGDVPGCPGCRN